VARTSLRVVLFVVLTVCSSVASAGGMFLPVRGTRALGRGGAFTAGVDDGSAIYYNPAGMADIDGVSFLLDGALDFQRVSYTRVDSGGNVQPMVNGDMNILPIPTLAITWKPQRVQWFTLGFGVWVPYLGINTYPEKGPQRYSNITLNGSLLATLEVAAAFRIRDWLWLGVGLQNMFLHFHSRVDLSACSGLSCAPEQPSFDSLTEVNSDSWFTPSANVGAIVALPKFRGGFNVQLPFFVRSNGSVRSRLPSDPMFANATLNGSAVSVDFNIPLMVRLGFEYRPFKKLRLETDFDYEAWSMQDQLLVQPHNIYISGVPGVGNYYLNTLKVARSLNDTFAVHLGVEYEAMRKRLWMRAGWAIDTNATPNATASVLIPDSLRNLLTVGLGLWIWKARADIAYAHVFFNDRTVTDSRSFQLNPIQPATAVPVGNGRYSIAADVISAGLDARF
jgi:long-chain fatty acid transport protein